MLNSLKLQNPSSIKLRHLQNSPENNNRRLYHTTTGIQKSSFSSSIRFSSISLKPLQNDASSSSTTTATPEFTTSSIGSPNISHWNLTSRHITLLNLMACSVALSATWLFCSAIPTLLAFRRAAESLAKLLDVTREELPDTMAAMRLSGMEISDLTMELSDLGQEITKGVKSSTRAVRVAKERLHRLTNMTPSATLQEVAKPKTEVAGPRLARTARIAREGIVKGRTFWNMFLSLSQFSRMAQNFFASRAEL